MELRIKVGCMFLRDLVTDSEDVLSEFVHSIALTSDITKAVVYYEYEEAQVKALIDKLYVVLGVKAEINRFEPTKVEE